MCSQVELKFIKVSVAEVDVHFWTKTLFFIPF